MGKKIKPREVFCAVEQALDPPKQWEALVVRRAARTDSSGSVCARCRMGIAGFAAAPSFASAPIAARGGGDRSPPGRTISTAIRGACANLPAMNVPVPSPCNSDCHYDSEMELCQGCFRTLDEVARWLDMTVEERREVMVRVARRRRD